MTVCPACQHPEYEGALFCSECGARLWNAPGRETAAFDLPAPGGAVALPGEIILRFRGGQSELRLSGRQEYRLGRADEEQGLRPEADLTRHDAQAQGVSRLHAVLRVTGKALTLTDLDSANGTRVNGAKLQPHTPHTLADGDEVALGQLLMTVHFRH